MIEIDLRLMPIALGVALSGCVAAQDLPNHPGAVAAIEDYYRAHAWEDGQRCLLPEMDTTRAEIVEDSADRLVVETRYYWQDERLMSDNGGNTCAGFATRTFTLQQGRVVAMTGPQRP